MRIAMFAFPDVQMLDVTGPLEVFSRASRWLRDHDLRPHHVYEVEVVSFRRGPFRASSGLLARRTPVIKRSHDPRMCRGCHGQASDAGASSGSGWRQRSAGCRTAVRRVR